MSRRIASEDRHEGGSARGSAGPFSAALTAVLPDPVEVGAGTALVIDGTLRGPRPDRVAVRLGAIEREVDFFAMPPREPRGDPSWWVVLPIPGSAELGSWPLELLVVAADARAAIPLGEVCLVRRETGLAPPAPAHPDDGEGPLIAVCMATWEPRVDQLRRQLDSIRAQSWRRWICVVSDDCSSPERFAELEGELGDDHRFLLSRSPRRLGFYRNFERAMRMAPAEAHFIALADQDDRWDPDKLEALHATLERRPGAALAYSDIRITDDEGRILSETFWYLRRNNYDDIAALLVANTVTGAASLFRRELLGTALPLPPAHPAHEPYHDHWLALCALGLGEIAYLDRPTYHYTRHTASVTVQAQRDWLAPVGGRWGGARLRLRRYTRRFRNGFEAPGWFETYFDRYLLMRQLALALEQRLGDRIAAPKRRALRRFAAAERSPAAWVWLLARSLRPLIGRNETLSRERIIAASVLRSRTAAAAAARRRAS